VVRKLAAHVRATVQVGALVGELHPEHPDQIPELTALPARDFAVETRAHPPRWLLRARRRSPMSATAR
jgi:hypothetical protein